MSDGSAIYVGENGRNRRKTLAKSRKKRYNICYGVMIIL